MAELAVEKTYGEALFRAAFELDKVDEMLQDGKNLVEILEKEEDFRLFLMSPVISSQQKQEIFKKVFEGKMCPEMINFICILTDKSRMHYFPRIIREFENLINHKNNVLLGEIYSVEKLDEERLRKFEEQVAKLLQVETVRLENRTDKSLIAGVRIYADYKLIDASVRRQLDKMSESILK